MVMEGALTVLTAKGETKAEAGSVIQNKKRLLKPPLTV